VDYHLCGAASSANLLGMTSDLHRDRLDGTQDHEEWCDKERTFYGSTA
jgi:hypothetical protein